MSILWTLGPNLVLPSPKNSLSLLSCPKTEPISFKEAYQKPQWQKAMVDEFNVLMANDIWELVPHNFA